MTTKLPTQTVLSLALVLTTTAHAQQTPRASQGAIITRSGSLPSQKGTAENFTGSVTIVPLFAPNDNAPYGGSYVTFEAGARSAWHTHPYGQRLVVTSGIGRTAQWGGPVQEIKVGDVVWCPPGVKHWHGASPNSAMTHLALTGTVNNKNVEWLEKVTEAQYNQTRSPLTQYTPGGQTMNTTQALSAGQRGIIPIAAFTVTGDQEKLKVALTEGLEAGLTVNQIKEILIQMYAYAGFPRSLNGIQTFMTLIDERKAKGIHDEEGPQAAPLPADTNKNEYGAKVRATLAGKKEIPPPSGYQLFAPAIDTFLKEHLFADIFARDILSYQERELATVAALASMTGTRAQLQAHIGMAMNTGLSESQIRDLLAVLEAKVGQKEAESAREVLTTVLNGK